MTKPKLIVSKLPLSLIPTSTHGQRLSGDLIETHLWDRIRKWVYRKANYQCEVCKGVGPDHPVECHEYWRWDSVKRVQYLDRVVALCPLCHQTVHICGTGKQQGPDAFRLCMDHLQKLNGWDVVTVEKYVSQELAICAERCEIKFDVNIGAAHGMLCEASRVPLDWPKQ